MKKYILACTLLLYFTAPSTAQYTKLGGKGGFSFYNFNNFSRYYGSRDSFHGGMYLERVYTDVLSLRVEGLYSQKGPNIYASNRQGGTFEAVLKLHYLDIPALIKYQVVEDVYVYVGPQLSFLLKRDAKLKNQIDRLEVDETGSKVELGMAGGLSFDVFYRFTVDVRYSRGLLNFSREGFKNSGLQASIGYMIFTQ